MVDISEQDVIRHFRPGTDDDKFVIPELILADMYRMAELAEIVNATGRPVLDCGAHIGAFSCYLADQGATVDIIAYEPICENYALLAANASRYRNVKWFPYAVAPKTGRVALHDGHGTGRWSAMPDKHHAAEPTIEVDAISFWALLGSLQPSLVKLDLEGYEAALIDSLDPGDLFGVEVLVLEEHHVEVNRDNIERDGLEVWFHPYDSDAHTVYRRKP